MKTTGVPRHRASRRQRCPGPGPRLRGRGPRHVSQPFLATATPTPPKPFCAVLPGRPQPRRPGVPSVCFGALRQSTSEAGSADSRTPHPLLRGVGRACVLDSSPVKCLLSVSGGSEACRPGPALRGLEVGACGPRPPFSVAVAGRAGEGRERTRPRPQTGRRLLLPICSLLQRGRPRIRLGKSFGQNHKEVTAPSPRRAPRASVSLRLGGCSSPHAAACVLTSVLPSGRWRPHAAAETGLRSAPRAVLPGPSQLPQGARQTDVLPSCRPQSPLFLPLPSPCPGLSRGTGSRAQAPRSLRRRV